MENEKKPSLPINQDDDFLEPYYKKPFFTFTFWRWVIMGIAFVAAVIFFKFAVLDPSMDANELKASIQLLDLSSQWVVKEKVNNKEFKGITVVPEVSFRFRNIGKRELRFVYCICVYRWANNGKLIGEGYGMTLRQPLAPNQESEEIVLRCPFGYNASSLDSFKENPKEWRNAFAELYARSKNSKTIELKTITISRRIAGTDIDVTIK